MFVNSSPVISEVHDPQSGYESCYYQSGYDSEEQKGGPGYESDGENCDYLSGYDSERDESRKSHKRRLDDHDTYLPQPKRRCFMQVL